MATKKTKREKKIKSPKTPNITPRLTAEQIVERGEKAEKATKPATAVSTGANLAVMAGRPSKQAVVSVFTKSGYALSWVARAAKLGVTPEALCERFKTDPEGVKADWEKLTTAKS